MNGLIYEQIYDRWKNLLKTKINVLVRQCVKFSCLCKAIFLQLTGMIKSWVPALLILEEECLRSISSGALTDEAYWEVIIRKGEIGG